MKMKNKVLSAFVSMVTVLSMSGLAVNAANTSNTPWNVGKNYCRYKTDYSAVYVSNVSMIYSASVSVYGEYGEAENNKYPVGYNTENLTLSPNTERRIRQYVNEWGYYCAHIYFSNPGSGNNSASGQWSPDSYGSYDYLN